MGNTSVLIVSYRTAALTDSAVRSALRAEGVGEVVVHDNASGDGTTDALASIEDGRLNVQRGETNVGFGRAANQAARAASGDVLLFLNSDAEVGSGTVAALRNEVDRFGGRAIVGPRLTSPNGDVQRSAGLLPGPPDLALRALGLTSIGRAISGWPVLGGLVRSSRIAKEYESAYQASSTTGTTMVSGACFAIGRQAFAELGGFDERFFMYFEDADLCRRARKAGMAIRYVPQAVVPHIGGASSSEDYHFSPRHARSMRLYLGKWYGPPGAALAAVLMFLRAVGFSVGAPRRAGRVWKAFGATLGFGGGRP